MKARARRRSSSYTTVWSCSDASPLPRLDWIRSSVAVSGPAGRFMSSSRKDSQNLQAFATSGKNRQMAENECRRIPAKLDHRSAPRATGSDRIVLVGGPFREGMDPCDDRASIPRSCVNARPGWSSTTPPSIRRSGRRFGRLARSRDRTEALRRRDNAGDAWNREQLRKGLLEVSWKRNRALRLVGGKPDAVASGGPEAATEWWS